MHFPVLKEEVLDFLSPCPGDVILDATLGGGGHSREILRRIVPGGKLIALDRDIEAIEKARRDLSGSKDSVLFIHGNFRDVKTTLKEKGIERLHGAVFDLGFSSNQLDDPSRGFSFMHDGPLDMRFDRLDGITAYEAVNECGKDELAEIIREYGEERHARAIAAAIVKARKTARIKTTKELSGVISRAVGRKYSSLKIHPSCRTFQAIRIYVNDEIRSAEKGIEGAASMLLPGKRICVISFHSLEDRVAKNIFRREAKFGALKVITKKPVLPAYTEIKENPRSRSAKLRVAEGVR